MIQRRRILQALIVAPAIVKASSLMRIAPVRPWIIQTSILAQDWRAQVYDRSPGMESEEMKVAYQIIARAICPPVVFDETTRLTRPLRPDPKLVDWARKLLFPPKGVVPGAL